MGQYFPCRVPLSYNFSATPEEIESRAQNLSSGIRDDVGTLRSQAEALASQARNIISSVSDFTAGNIGPINFSAALGHYGYVVPNLGEGPTVYRMGPVPPFTGTPPSLSLTSFDRSSFTQPTADSVTFAEVPPRPGSVGVPSDPQVPVITIPELPAIQIELPALPAIGNAPGFAGAELDPDPFVPIEPIALAEFPVPGLSGLDRLEAAINNRFERRPYDFKLLDQALTACSAMLNGNFIIDMEALETGLVSNIRRALAQHHQRTNNLWSRRGFPANNAAMAYNDNLTGRVSRELEEHFEASLERWQMRLIPTAMQLGVEANSLMVEILGELYDLDFEFLEAEHAALQSLFALAAARYNLALLELERQAAIYAAEASFVTAKAEAHMLRVQQQRSVGRLNRARADGYVAENRAKEAQGDGFMAEVAGEGAKVQAHDARMEAVRARAQALRARLLQYEGDVAAWSGQLAQVRAGYRENRARNREVVARNRQVVAQTSADVADRESVAHVARASAIDAVAMAANLRAQIANRLADNTGVEIGNAMSALQYVADVSDYRTDLAQISSELTADRIQYRAQSQLNSSIASTYGQISDATVRAAQLTQQYRTQLANAYQSLYETAGRADAARASGELSRYRASMALRTVGAVDFASQLTSDVSYSADTTNSASNTCRTEYEAPKV